MDKEMHREHLKQHQIATLNESMRLELEKHYKISRELHLKYIKEESKNNKLKKRLSNIDKEFLIECYTYMAIIGVSLFCVLVIISWIVKWTT